MSKFKGFSLIELLIAVTLGMLSIAAVGSVFIYGSRNYKEDEKLARMQDELRFAMAALTADLEMAGFFAQVRSPVIDITADITATITNDCGPTTNGGASTNANNWTYQERRAFIATRGNATATEANASFPCIATSDFVAGTDIIAIKRLGDVVAAPSPGQVYLRTNGIDSTLYKHSDSPPPAPTGGTITVYEYRPTVWYIGPRAFTGQNPAVPSLCRKFIDPSGPTFDRECLAQGIVDMQLEFGLDNAANPDGVADQFVEIGIVPGANAEERSAYLARVVAVRVHLLARSAEVQGGYTNVKSYTLAGKDIAAANDGYYRKTLSSIVLLRNPANRLNPFALPTS